MPVEGHSIGFVPSPRFIEWIGPTLHVSLNKNEGGYLYSLHRIYTVARLLKGASQGSIDILQESHGFFLLTVPITRTPSSSFRAVASIFEVVHTPTPTSTPKSSIHSVTVRSRGPSTLLLLPDCSPQAMQKTCLQSLKTPTQDSKGVLCNPTPRKFRAFFDFVQFDRCEPCLQGCCTTLLWAGGPQHMVAPFYRH